MNRLPLVILAVLVLGSAGFGLFQLEQVKKLTQSASAWDSERADLQKRIWELQKRNGELEKRRPAVPAPTTVADDGPPPGENGLRGENGPPDARFRGRNEAGRFSAMMANPEVIKLMAMQQKASLDGRYSSLFKQLQLNPADLEKFKDLLVEKQAAVMDVMAAARAEGLNGRDGRDQIRQLVQDAQTEADNNIRATLGDAAYAQYQNYESTQPQRNVVSQLEQRLSYSPTPLTDAQSQQLVQILTNTTPPAATRNNGNGVAALAANLGGRGGPGGGGTQITTDAINQAQSILSAQQVTALQSLQQEQQASAQLREQMRANFQPQSPTGATSSVGATPATPAPAK